MSITSLVGTHANIYHEGRDISTLISGICYKEMIP